MDAARSFARVLQRVIGPGLDTGEVSDYANDLWLFFGIQAAFFALVPAVIMVWRLLTAFSDGLLTVFKPPIGRRGQQRSPASALRFFLFERSQYGYYMDIAQAVFSAISCIMFIAVAYSSYDPVSVQDIEFFFTCYFFADFCLRLYIAQDSLSFFFSGVSLLDFITVVPAIVTWLMSGLTAFETDVQVIVQCIRVMRVFRIFRVIRVIRVISVNQSYAFQRQVFVLVMTVLSLVFAAAGLFQVFESQPGKEYPFHKAVYYAAITVIGRPGVPFTAAVTAVFLTGLALSAATIIPTFVAELIRLWYDNTALDWYTHNPEAPHVIVCGDTNASRLRVLVTQYFHPSRNPNELGPIVILAEGKPEGALRALLEQYKHSGAVQYIRGSGRRTADLRRAKAQFASTAIVLNYRADKDPGTADTEVLSTIMAVKSVKPSIRVLAQLQRPRKRNQLKLVPGWSDGDKAIAAHALGMALVGVGTRLPGFPTLVTHLLRRGAGHEASAPPSLRSRMAAGWATFLHGEGAAGTGQDFRDVDDATGRLRSRTPLDEYAASMDNSLYEVWVTPGLVGRTFGAAARLAYLRYGVTLIGATVPVNEALHSVMPGLPRTFRTALFPADAVLSLGMRLYAISPYAEPLQQMHLETGGRVRNVLEKVVDDVKWLPFAGVVPPEVAAAGVGVEAKEGEIPVAVPAPDGTAGGISIPLPSFSRPGEQYAHNNGASADLTVAWCWAEHDLDGGNTNAFLALLHMNVGGSASGEASGHSTGGAGLCERCGKPSAKRLDARLLAGVGIRTLDASRGLSAFEGAPPAALAVGVDNPLSLPTKQAAPVSGAQFDPFSGAQGEAEEEEQGTPAASSGSGPSDSPSLPSALALALNPIVGRDGRRPSMGDDGFGGIDDTDDVVGMRGPLVTATPSLKNAGSAAAAASAATAANTNALAVRLALPMGAQASEDLTLVMPTGAGGSGLASAAGGKPSFTGHVLVCGVSESIGLLLRALASLTTQARAAERGGVRALSTTLATAPKDYAEGEQYDIGPADVIVLAAAKPTDAAMNAMYAGSSLLLSRVTFLTGSPGDTAELVRAGVMGAKCAVVLTQAKPSVSADGSDNLSDDTEAIMTTAMLHKLNPSLHITTELLHGGHAPFILPVGASLNDAQRQAFAHILEEREAGRQRAQLDEAIRKLQSEQGVSLGNGTAASGSPASARLLAKLLRQQARLRALHGQPSPGGRGRAAGGTLSALDTRSAESMSLAAGGRVGGEREVEASYSGLSSTAIVDVLVGVREDFNAGAGAAGSEGAGFGGGAGGAAGGSSKGSGATADLFSSPAFASGRVFSFATLDSIITEAHFAPYMVPLVKQLVRAARRHRLSLIPVTEAIVMARIAASINVRYGARDTAAPSISAEAVARVRQAYLAEVASKMKEGGRDSGSPAAAVVPEDMKFERYGQLFEALLRCWHLLPLGIYRRVHPATGLKTAPATSAAVAAAAGMPAVGDAFGHNRAAVSFVVTNPSADCVLSPHDLIYVLSVDDEETSDARIAGLELDAGGE